MKTVFKLIVVPFFLLAVCCKQGSEVKICIPENAGSIEQLAAKEIRKYIFLRSNLLAEIQLGEKDGSQRIELAIDTLLKEQEYKLKTSRNGEVTVLVISGGSPVAVLYGAYEFAEQLGIRFYLHGDVIPDEKISFSIPDLNLQQKPFFATRGILPFHDFPEGPDWWNEGDYEAILAQLPKMKMNFIGFHTYPYRSDFNGEGPKAEPLVWIGKENDINKDGTVKTAYPVLHFSTGDSTWGYQPAHTSEFLSGASQLFETDTYGADYIKKAGSWPHSDEENTDIFNESGNLFSSAFEFAKALGVKVCVGTETPLIIPRQIKMKYGIKEESEQDIKDLYKGIFKRIKSKYPIDYYWLWTPEDWTWNGVQDKVVEKTIRDMQIAYEALAETGNPFKLATCGWVLGPPEDRALFDRVLPADMPFSCINRGVGYTPVEKGFAAVGKRTTWSIPWMEDDPDLLATQLWVGRLRKDAADSWKYGCDGLMGIHWRTRILGPNVSALAKAAWECDRYDSTSGRDLRVDDFYNDWVKSEFGINSPELAGIFSSIDSKGVESGEGHKGDSRLNASDWISGPGALMTNQKVAEISERIARYDFLSGMESYRKNISGAGNLERFDYWLNALKFNRAILETARARVELNETVNRLKKEIDKNKQVLLVKGEAIPKRIELAEKWKAMNQLLLSFVSTNGELGTIANLEMHNIRKNGYLTGSDSLLRSILQADLPQAAFVSKKYSGKTRIISTTNQTILRAGENFYLRIRILSESDHLTGKIFYRALGENKYSSAGFTKIASHVFDVTLPANRISTDFEYYIQVDTGKEKILYPATAENINNTVIIL